MNDASEDRESLSAIFERLIANTGDSVTTYGEPWNMN